MREHTSSAANPRTARPSEAELKYTVPSTRVETAIALLGSRFDPDPEHPIGVVSSIYYDSRDWHLLKEKRNSDYLKTKVRLRWYLPADGQSAGAGEFAFAEVKGRIGSTRSKHRMQTQITAVDLQKMPLNAVELMSVPQGLKQQGILFDRPIFPVFVVRYIRRRYVERTTQKRICIDYDITSPKVNQAILTAPLPFALKSAVIEVKSRDHDFPIALRPLLPLGLQRAAFSKYYECYAALTNTFF